MDPRSRNADRVIARVASRAKGIATRGELLAAGITGEQIKGRLRRGSLIPQFPGVYRVGHAAPSVEASYMAAVKACGGGAALAGMAAAHLMQLVRGKPPRPEVSAPGERAIAGVVTHRSRRIEKWTFNGIQTTTPARTLVDIAGRLGDEELTRAVHEAQVRFRTNPRQVEAVLRRRPNAPGAAKLRAAITGDSPVTLSALERKFRQRLRDADLPLSDDTNQYAGEHRVDCRWVEQKLTVELDSYRFHNTRHAFEQDRRRERAAYARGDQHRRYTAHDVFDEPAAMLAELAALLG